MKLLFKSWTYLGINFQRWLIISRHFGASQKTPQFSGGISTASLKKTLPIYNFSQFVIQTSVQNYKSLKKCSFIPPLCPKNMALTMLKVIKNNLKTKKPSPSSKTDISSSDLWSGNMVMIKSATQESMPSCRKKKSIIFNAYSVQNRINM